MSNIAILPPAVKVEHGLSVPAQPHHLYNSSSNSSSLPPSPSSNSSINGWCENAGCRYRLVLDAVTLTAHRPKASHKPILAEVNRIIGNYSPHDTGIRLAAIKRSKAASYRLSVELLQPNTPERVAVHGRWDQHAPTALVQLDPRSDGYAFLRIEWNPRRWAAWQLPSLLGRINDLLLKPSDLGAMFLGASVTRADIAADLTVRGDRYYWSRSKATLRRPWVNEATGQVETLYLGTGKAKNAHGAVKVYAADLLHDDLPEGDVTRVECTVRSGKTRLLVSDLPGLTNPLLTIGCLDVVKAAKDAKLSVMLAECLFDKCLLRGIAHTQQWLHSQSPDMAVRFAKSIKSATPAFWTPGAFWKLWPSVLQQALPWMFEANSHTTNMQAA